MKIENVLKSDTKNFILVIVLVISVIVFGISTSYAFYTASMVGSNEVPLNTAANLNVTSTLTTSTVISSAELALIEADEYETKGEHVSFTVTNHDDSNVNAKYTISLEQMSMKNNLFSKYLKWKIIVNKGTTNEQVIDGDFADATISAEGNTDKTLVSDLTKSLVSDNNPLQINIGVTDTVDFYIWLENDAKVNQIYLTSGTFSAKLAINAVPSK